MTVRLITCYKSANIASVTTHYGLVIINLKVESENVMSTESYCYSLTDLWGMGGWVYLGYQSQLLCHRIVPQHRWTVKAVTRWDTPCLKSYFSTLCVTQSSVSGRCRSVVSLLAVGEVAREEDEEDIPLNIHGPDIGVLVRLYAIHTK